jgi:hypothetical protein
VFSAGCSEIDRMIRFREHLRVDEADRVLYERTKRDLAACRWRYAQDYADAKSDVIVDIMTRAQSMQQPEHPARWQHCEPRPRSLLDQALPTRPRSSVPPVRQ